jgi:phosphoribosylcarboxyaminoimidazole (NCAIR) mutase
MKETTLGKGGPNMGLEKVKRIAIILGSRSDWPKIQQVVTGYTADRIKIVVHVTSCHRNPYEVVDLAEGAEFFDAVICVGGKAFALPGVLDAFIHANGLKTPVIGVAIGEPGSEELSAALLSIKQIPGQPVIMDNTEVYCGPTGLMRAINRIIDGGLPNPKERQEKPSELEIFRNFEREEQGRLSL